MSEVIVHLDRVEGAFAALSSTCAVIVDGHLTFDRCKRWVDGVYRGRDVWTHDFGGEQFSLGSAFYTHLEEGRSGDYFAEAAVSDERVEMYAPDLQRSMRELVEKVLGAGPGLGATVTQRRGWCGPGVHVFPPGGPVALRGGVCHFDTEGLSARHLQQRRPAITIVAMLQTPEMDGGLKVWDVRYDGSDHPTEQDLEARSGIVSYGIGDIVLIDSYRLHQIQPFSGSRERISATVHASYSGAGVWECWF